MTDATFDPAARWAPAAEGPGLSDDIRSLVATVFEPRPREDGAVLPVPPSRLDDAARAALAGAVGDEHVRTDDTSRAHRANGMSYLDLMRRRVGAAPAPPDAVVLPGDDAQVAAVLSACAEHRLAVVPFGGGTSVVGGVTPDPGALRAVVALDLARLDALLDLDPVSRTATLGAGLTGPRAEELLIQEGFTLGHVPQSYERATIGGYAATRSAGQLSTGWGRFDDLVERVRLVAPAGTLDLGRSPGTAAGPDLRELVLGSEGAFGVITQVTVRVRPVPEARRYEAFRVASFADGVAFLRGLAQDGPAPDLARLSDETETAMGVAGGGGQGGCLMLLGWEGGADEVARRAEPAVQRARAAGAEPLGDDAVEAWRHARFDGPKRRDDLLDAGVLVETLETSATWAQAEALHGAVSGALRTALDGDRPVVACHLSHLYASGASLYFSVFARQDAEDPVRQWERAKAAASDAITAAGATITHHHAVGRDHAPWMAREVGELGLEVLAAVKGRLDPGGIMNPGALLGEARS
jgi:alkyldihydroxyacetonephosphate synthase